MTEMRTVRRMRVGGFLSALALAGVMVTGGIAQAQDAVQIEVIVPGTPGTPIGDTLLASPITGISNLVTFAPDQWTGSAQVPDPAIYGRPAAALYAQSTGEGTGALSFALSDDPTGDVLLTLVGLDDDAPTKTPIEVTIDKKSVYKGDAWFQDWGGKVGEGNWTTVQLTIPKGLLGPGVNDIIVSNTAATGDQGETPYILLGGALLEVPGVTVSLSGA